MAKLNTDELLDAFKEMTLLELSEFVKKFEEVFEVTAAAPVAVADDCTVTGSFGVGRHSECAKTRFSKRRNVASCSSSRRSIPPAIDSIVSGRSPGRGRYHTHRADGSRHHSPGSVMASGTFSTM